MKGIAISKNSSGKITVAFSYKPEFVVKVKTISDRRWHTEGKHWSFPNSNGILEKILEVLKNEEIQIHPALKPKPSSDVIARPEKSKQPHNSPFRKTKEVPSPLAGEPSHLIPSPLAGEPSHLIPSPLAGEPSHLIPSPLAGEGKGEGYNFEDLRHELLLRKYSQNQDIRNRFVCNPKFRGIYELSSYANKLGERASDINI